MRRNIVEFITRVILDTLAPKGRFELKRMLAVMAFNCSILYAFTPIVFAKFKVLEFVFFSLITFCATAIGIKEYFKNKE